MKQRVLLIFVFGLFSFTWSSVVYQVLRQPPQIIYAAETAKALVNEDFPTELIKQEVAKEEVNREIQKEKVTKTQTQKNKQIKPSLEAGIDYGEGISVDDLLKSFGLAMTN